MQVRKARSEDAAAIAEIDVASWRAAYGELMPASYLDSLDVAQKAAGWRRGIERDAAKGKRTLVVEAEGQVVGFAVVGPDDEAGPGLLWLMYVHPEHWGRGAAPPLMDISLDALLELGHSTARLWVLQANTRARRFYERCGWIQDGATGVATHGGADLSTVRYSTELSVARSPVPGPSPQTPEGVVGPAGIEPARLRL